jgi:hypothetical protein
VSTPLRERPDAPLGTLIFRAGLLPAETIESALEEGVKTGKRLGEILTERGLISEVDLARLLAGQKGLEFVTLREQIVDPTAASLFTEEQARLFRALPYSFDGELPVVAIADPTDEVLIRNIREALGREDARFVVTARGELAEIAADVYSRPLTPPQPEAAPEPEAEREPVAEPAAEAEATPAPVEEPEAETAPRGEHLNGNATVDAELIVAAPTYEPAPVPQPEPAPVVSEPVPEPTAFQVPAPEAPAAPEPLATPEPTADAAQPASAAPEEPAALAPEPPASLEPAPVPQPAAVSEAHAAPEPPALAQPPVAPPFPPAPEPSPALDAPTPEPPTFPEPVPFPEPEPAPSPPPYPPAAAAPEPAPPPVPEQPESTPTAPEPAVVSTTWRLTIRLTNGERVEAGDFADQDSAMQEAKAVMGQVADADSGEWPFVSGRFLKPDTIVSVDIAELSGNET